MVKIETLALDEAEKLRESGDLKFVSYEFVDLDDVFSERRLQSMAEKLGADFVGVPSRIGSECGFYKSNFAA